MKRLILLSLALILLAACGRVPIEPALEESAAATGATAETETTAEEETTAEAETETLATDAALPAATNHSTVRPTTTNPTTTRPLSGLQAPFSVGFQVNTHARAQEEDDAVVITSRQALEEFHAQYGDANNRLAGHLRQYNNAWFNTRSLIIITRTEGSGSIRHTVETLIPMEWMATVFVSHSVPEIGTADMAYWVIALEVDNSHMEGITQAQAIYYFYDERGFQVREGMRP